MRKGRVYARRRALAAILFALTGWMVWAGAGVVVDHIQDLSTPDFVCDTESVMAEPGDTIFALVLQHCDSEDIMYVVYIIVDGRGNASLQPGDIIYFPKG